MQIHIARNGVTLGSFTLEELKAKVDSGEIMQMDHVYTKSLGRWKSIYDVPEFRELFPQVAEKPIPPPPGAESISAIKPEPELDSIIVLLEAKTGEERFHEYPIQYWKEYFGDESYWFLDTFKDMQNNPENGDKDNSTDKKIKFSFAALIFGWGWLAYRKCIGWSVFMFLVSWGLSFYVWNVAKAANVPPDPDSTFTKYQIMSGVVAICLMQILPSLLSNFFFHEHVIGVFKSVEKKISDSSDRLRRIKDRGGISWLYTSVYIVLLVVLNVIALS